jgi:hypothetical protein
MSSLAIKANPNWDPGQWEAINKFRTDDQTQKAIGRIAAIADSGSKMESDLEEVRKLVKDDPTMLGRMVTEFQTKNFTDNPAFSNLFQDWQTFIIDSNALTTGGGGLEGETEQMIKSIPLYGQITAYEGALKRHASFALSRYNQYQNQWTQLQRTDKMFGHNDAAAAVLQHLANLKETRAAPSTGGGPTTAPSAPPRPSQVPPGSSYSPSRKQWRDTDGKMYDAEGNPL